jgi:hypothetical protein
MFSESLYAPDYTVFFNVAKKFAGMVGGHHHKIVAEQIGEWVYKSLCNGVGDVWGGYGSEYNNPKYNNQTLVDKYGEANAFDNFNSEKTIEKAARTLPGVGQTAHYPCECIHHGGRKSTDSIFGIIIHLNDTAKWSREDIADWLDELHDSGQVNIEFDPWEDEYEHSNQG